MTRALLFIIIIGFMGLTSCGSSGGTLIDMSYGETQCADVWGTFGGSSESEVQVAVVSYFDNLGITVSDISLVDNGPIITCQACDCLSNRVISLQVGEDNLTKMEAEGFIKS